MRLSECLFVLMLLSPSAALAENRAPPEGARAMADAHVRRGSELFEQKAYREALLEFQRAYAITPDSQLLQSISQAKVALQNDAAAAARREAKQTPTASERPPVVSITLTFHQLELNAQTVRTLSQLAQVHDDGRALSIVLQGLGGERAPAVAVSNATVAKTAQSVPPPEASDSAESPSALAAADSAGKKARVVRGIDELDPYSATE